MKHRSATPQKGPRRIRRAAIAVVAAAAIGAGITFYNKSADPAGGPLPVHLPTTPQSYLGVYTNGFPASYAGLPDFARATRSKPDIAMYYSGWYESFPVKFATNAAHNGVVPLVQMDPKGINLSAIASGRYDGYLSAYAEVVRAYHDPVIMSFGHEMNGTWYGWGYTHTSPHVFVAAWRYIVKLFRDLGATNVTWLWTVNIIDDTQVGTIPSPAAWWPGDTYVNWVGIDGYYLKPSWAFAPLFGPTITAIHRITDDPILIAETGAVVTAGQPSKIANLMAGVRAYGLLGFVWFDAVNSHKEDFRINSPAAIAAFRTGADSFRKPGS